MEGSGHSPDASLGLLPGASRTTILVRPLAWIFHDMTTDALPASLGLPADASPAAIIDAAARTARTVRTPCADGAMVWRVWGKGEPLVLFHGGSGSWLHWIRNIPVLSRHYELWVAD